MKVIAFITDFSVVDRIINHLELTFVAAKPPPPHIANEAVHETGKMIPLKEQPEFSVCSRIERHALL